MLSISILLWIFQEKKWSYLDFCIGLVVTFPCKSERPQVIMPSTMPSVMMTKTIEKCILLSGTSCQIESHIPVYLKVCYCGCEEATLLNSGINREKLGVHRLLFSYGGRIFLKSFRIEWKRHAWIGTFRKEHAYKSWCKEVGGSSILSVALAFWVSLTATFAFSLLRWG